MNGNNANNDTENGENNTNENDDDDTVGINTCLNIYKKHIDNFYSMIYLRINFYCRFH